MEFIAIILILILSIFLVTLKVNDVSKIDKPSKNKYYEIDYKHNNTNFLHNTSLKQYSSHIEENKKNINEQEMFGQYGEQFVADMLLEIAKKYDGKVINNFTFKDYEGFSTNIDHILICKGGLFIVETKANKGIIFGKSDDEYWLSQKLDYQEDKTFKNPVKQNLGHINHLKKMMKHHLKMFSLIIFPFADSLNNIDSKYVFDLDSAYDFIVSKIANSKYSDYYVKNIYEELIQIKNIYGISLEEHVKNINELYH